MKIKSSKKKKKSKIHDGMFIAQPAVSDKLDNGSIAVREVNRVCVAQTTDKPDSMLLRQWRVLDLNNNIFILY